MAAILKGNAVCWSTGGVKFTAGIISDTTTNFTQSTRLQRTSEKANIKDAGGVVKAQVFHGFMKSLSITVIPYASDSSANAVVSAEAYMLTPGTLITITDSAGNAEDNYNLISATENRTVDGVRTIDLELEAGDEGTELATANLP